MTFSGTTDSDFLKLVSFPSSQKEGLIDFAASDFTSLRIAILNYIKAVYPLDYSNFIESDLGIMLVDLIAFVGSVTSMKADYLANENFLRTARNRNNVKKLLELIGVRLKGPISAAANAQLSFENTPYVGSGDQLSISFENRVIQITSPLDNQPLNYTIYKVVNGLVDTLNSDASIILTEDEAVGYSTGDVGVAKAHTNLVLLEGALVRKTGEFDLRNTVKTIEITEGPIVEGSVQLYVDGSISTSGNYTQVDNIYFASGAASKVFQIVSDDDFRGTVVFGDGLIGVSPAPGDSYILTYRIGGGSRGNIAKEVINSQITVSNDTQATSHQGTIENISIGTGGSDAETVEHAKKYAPLTFRRQDRVVTLPDFVAFANTFISSYGSIGKATAAVRRAYSSANIIDLYVLEKASNTQLRKATPTFKKQLLDALSLKKMLTDEVVVVDGLIRTIDLVVTARIDKEVRENEEIIKLQIKDRILSYFSVDNRDFGQEFNPADIARYIFSIPSVRFATVDNFKDTVKIDFNEIIQLNNVTINIVRV